ncbi:MAG: hypothetical protein FRX49_05896 [Trebouxia sp. A1-2]|nr:MAG: hypothetical protein FRX49_05896 [Trebouxia sp. A1-2]
MAQKAWLVLRKQAKYTETIAPSMKEAQDFKGVWPIKDTRQQKDYRKETLVPLELMEPGMMVATAQSRQQCKRFMANAATYSSMQEHLQSLVDLQKLVDSVLDGNTHPHAIDGQQLSEPLQATANGDADMHKGSADQPQAAHFPSNSIDIVQLLQALVHQVAAAMPPTASEVVGQENVTPTAGTSSSRQEARLHLVPPTPLSTAPMQAAAVSVAAKRDVLQERTWSALTPSQGGTAMKASVHQAAMVREHKWTPGGARMPLKVAMPPSTVRPTTRSRMERHHGPAVMTSVVKRGRDLLAPSPISEEDEGVWGIMAGPRRLSYSSPNDQKGRTPTQQAQEYGHQKSTPADATISTVMQSIAKPVPEAPLSVAALLARMQKLKSFSLKSVHTNSGAPTPCQVTQP